jgi:hypothetical protein
MDGMPRTPLQAASHHPGWRSRLLPPKVVKNALRGADAREGRVLPKFTAHASSYRSQHHYYGGVNTASWGATQSGQSRVRPAQAFICDGPVCTCDGLPDCIDMFGTDLCGPVAACDSTSGLVCGCIRK